MSVSDLERELARHRGAHVPPSNAVHLSPQEGLAYRNTGNLPDELGRSLRLVLHVRDRDDIASLDKRRALYEPDHHDAPTWRREGSKPVNVVPLRIVDEEDGTAREVGPWWEDPEVAELEREWQRAGTIAGLRVPGEYRSFVYKTVIALRKAQREITADSVVDSVSRWLPPQDAERLRAALKEG